MAVSKKSVLISIGTLALLATIGFAYAVNVATGSDPKWDPEGYVDVEANGMRFSVNVRGNQAHPPVILLHGFPESAVMWDKFMDELAGQDYYAIAPNQRGYSSGARPLDIESYALDPLISDVIKIADSMGIKQFHLIGHDWGAAVGWKLAADHPDRILSYLALSVPHIDSFGIAYREDTDQYEASDYIRFFQNKVAPEYVLAKNDYEGLKSVWTSHDDAEIRRYLKLFQQEHALTSAINWYRANYPAFDVGLNIGKISVPTTFIWGNKDVALKRSGIAGTADYVAADYTYIEMDAGHWIIQEKYDELTPHMLEHLSKYR